MRSLVVIVAWLIAMVASARAEANSSEPIYAPPGAFSAGSEPAGLAEIEILVETLVFDLRPLDDGEPPTVRDVAHSVRVDAGVSCPRRCRAASRASPRS